MCEAYLKSAAILIDGTICLNTPHTQRKIGTCRVIEVRQTQMQRTGRVKISLFHSLGQKAGRRRALIPLVVHTRFPAIVPTQSGTG